MFIQYTPQGRQHRSRSPKLTKSLGIILDGKKDKGILMLCKRAVDSIWGFKPATMRWI